MECCVPGPADSADSSWEVSHSNGALRAVAVGRVMTFLGGWACGRSPPRTIEHWLHGYITGTRKGQTPETASELGVPDTSHRLIGIIAKE